MKKTCVRPSASFCGCKACRHCSNNGGDSKACKKYQRGVGYPPKFKTHTLFTTTNATPTTTREQSPRQRRTAVRVEKIKKYYVHAAPFVHYTVSSVSLCTPLSVCVVLTASTILSSLAATSLFQLGVVTCLFRALTSSIMADTKPGKLAANVVNCWRYYSRCRCRRHQVASGVAAHGTSSSSTGWHRQAGIDTNSGGDVVCIKSGNKSSTSCKTTNKINSSGTTNEHIEKMLSTSAKRMSMHVRTPPAKQAR